MATNPYAAPQADVRDITATEYQKIRVFSPQGRIGRLRYLVYAYGISYAISLIMAVVMAAAPGMATPVTVLGYLLMLVSIILIGMKRSHDMNWSGWTVLLTLIPFVALIWLFKAGTDGANRFGNPPPPNSTAIKIFGFLIPILFIVAVVAAIAIPAYQDYVQRAQGLQ